VAYAGLDPKVRQSGITLKRNTHLTKRGSPYLRRAVYFSAVIASRFDPELKRYYLKKRSEGRRYREAMVATARKLLYRIYAVWKRGTSYTTEAGPNPTRSSPPARGLPTPIASASDR
jgi:transposase